MRVVLDTNVLISALAFPGSKPDEILSLVRRRRLELFVSPFIISELQHVLMVKFHFGTREARVRTKAIQSLARVVEPTEHICLITAKDDDNRILECAAAAQAEFLVTGDKAHLLPLGSYRNIRILSPAQFLDLMPQVQSESDR